MRYLLLFLLNIPIFIYAQKQIPFEGKLVYSVQITDTNLQKMIPIKAMVVFTNDTLLRIENETDQLGKQILIKHLGLNKSYLLLQTPKINFAIQTDHNVEKTDSFPFHYKKKHKKKDFYGHKAKLLEVQYLDYKEPMAFYYLKQYSVKYLNSFANFPGLLVEYYLPTSEGIYRYRLESIETKKVPKDLFGIPSDYKKVSFDEFLKEFLEMQSNEQN